MNDIHRPGPSLWEEADLPIQSDPLPETESDVCVIGAGIAGLTTAYLLAREGHQVVVIEARAIGGGQTSKTTAHLASALDDRFSHLEHVRGREVTQIAAESHATAIDQIERITREEPIDCDFARVDGHLFLAPEHDRWLLEQELAAARRAGLNGVELLERTPLPAEGTMPCIRFPNQGRMHPLRYLKGLAEAIRRRGGRIAIGSRVERAEGGERAKIVLEDGREHSTAAIVVATNTPFNDRFTIHTKQAPYLTYALAARVPDDHASLGLFWDTADPYHYVRTSATNEGAYLIVGGEDHKTGQASDQLDRFDRLEQWARERFPALGSVERRWSGQVMETMDGLAYIGRNPGDEPNVYIATGDSGMGMTHGTIAGMLLRDLIVGRENRWADAFDPSRLPVASTWDYAKENLNVALQYADWLTPGDVREAEAIARGSGAVLRDGVAKVAVYRDEADSLHAFSASCPHLGCVVAWNPAGETWDCPCHGSRFDKLGHLLQGPATKDLAAVELDRVSGAKAHGS